MYTKLAFLADPSLVGSVLGIKKQLYTKQYTYRV